MLTGNKGEWSEVYTLLKIISDKNLFSGNENMRKIEGLLFPIIKILREESNGTYEFSYEDDLVIINERDEIIKIPIVEFHNNAKILLEILQTETSRTFPVPEIETFVKSFNLRTLKAKSSVKSDIQIVIHDEKMGKDLLLGFSIKSQLGNPSTLLNAGKTTNFIYKIKGGDFSSEKINEINQIQTRSKIKDRINKIETYSGRFEFVKLENTTFENNLVLIDSFLPKILSEMLYTFYTTTESKIKNLTQLVSARNPLNYDYTSEHPFYFYKTKRFLTDIALGMMPSRTWDGTLDATGGYLVVREDGEVLCYHIYNRNEFENYLMNNTKFDTASSSRHDFGKIYNQGSDLFFKLNLQIRFLK